MKEFKFEKVGDISSTYPFLEIYSENSNKPFMEVSVDESKELFFKFYSNSNSIKLSLRQWEVIFNKAQDFAREVVQDEEDFESFMNPGK